MAENRFGNQEVDAVQGALAKHVEIQAGYQAFGITRCVHHFQISFLHNVTAKKKSLRERHLWPWN